MAWFSAYVELDVRLDGGEPPDELVDRLARWHGAVGVSPRGWLAVQLSIDAETIAHATEVAQLVVTNAAREHGYPNAAVIALEVMTDDEREARENDPPVPDLVDVKEAAEILGVTRQRVQQIADRLGGFRVGHGWVFPRVRVERYGKD